MQKSTLTAAALMFGAGLAIASLAGSYLALSDALTGTRHLLAWLKAQPAAALAAAASAPGAPSAARAAGRTLPALPASIRSTIDDAGAHVERGAPGDESHLLPGETEVDRALRVASEKDPDIAALLEDQDPAVRNAMLDFFVEDER